jgi:hypothetical protein
VGWWVRLTIHCRHDWKSEIRPISNVQKGTVQGWVPLGVGIAVEKPRGRRTERSVHEPVFLDYSWIISVGLGEEGHHYLIGIVHNGENALWMGCEGFAWCSEVGDQEGWLVGPNAAELSDSR